MISIHALHEESDNTAAAIIRNSTISIHALHEESDRRNSADAQWVLISIHALHEESDPSLTVRYAHSEFQSTLSMRRATGFPSVRRAEDTISIHALHEESDYLYIL